MKIIFTPHELKKVVDNEKKKKVFKMVRTSRKPISVTCLVNKKPICQMVIFC